MPECPRCKAVSEAKFCGSCGQRMSANNNAFGFVMFWIAATCLLFLIVATLKDRTSPTPSTFNAGSPPTPVWDWARVNSETFAFQPGEGRVSGEIPANGTASTKRISIRASSPVMAAFVDGEYRQLLLTNMNQANALPIFHCLQHNTLNNTITCGLDTTTKGYVFLIKDERTGGQSFGAGLMAALGNKKALEQATARNDVTLDYWEWRCVRNCTQ